MNEPTHIDLFSGIGGFALAARWTGFRTIAFCEIDKYCQKVLAKNFGAVADAKCGRNINQFGNASRRWNSQETSLARPQLLTPNIFDFDGTKYRGCSLLTGGFPCQPFSVAGKRRGKEDDRYLWPEMSRVIAEARPAWVLGENVPGIIAMELDNVLSDLEGIGYATRPFVIPACSVDARHRRDRLWIVAHSARIQPERQIERPQRERIGSASEPMANAAQFAERESTDETNAVSTSRRTRDESRNGGSVSNSGRDKTARHRSCEWEISKRDWWLPESDVGRVAHGGSQSGGQT